MLADRYIYTLMARDIVRGADLAWLQSVYSIALVPDLVLYLRVSPQKLIERFIYPGRTLDYWESGMDIGYSRSWYDSFIRYQTDLHRAFRRLQGDLRIRRRERREDAPFRQPGAQDPHRIHPRPGPLRRANPWQP